MKGGKDARRKARIQNWEEEIIQPKMLTKRCKPKQRIFVLPVPKRKTEKGGKESEIDVCSEVCGFRLEEESLYND